MKDDSESFQLSGLSSRQVKVVSKTWPKVLLLFFGVMLISTTSLIAQTPNFDQLKERFESGEVFVADFNHTYTDSYTGESVSSSGNIWIDKNRYKLQSEGQTVVVDGKFSRVYDMNRNRVIIDYYEPEDDDFAPSRMLSGIDSTYTVSEESLRNQTKITLESTDDFAVFVQVEIMLDRQNRPVKITAWDISDNEIVTRFEEGKFVGSQSGLFELEYPADAEVVDMRY
ncbi:LolA family protein [Gracilimonas mengyeensis]|uniref:Outer membrane lipoprotein-sorting protein n=1 Tax=Gracilimonas mengyeensis TaxID=1302730 RepID=A0A521DF08_9BACT|nr:outer-membrane lipoprotein carrier protein LolA [Gracilimonas mengyeensis]SMO69731.1 Outer membrane lipoprotein-sorting protein [Gracilimonas mengyeensis]